MVGSSEAGSMHGGIKTAAAIVLAILIVLSIGYVALMLNWSYSNGERAGWLQKLSRKGIVCKTEEGELSMIAIPGAAPEKFYFTVRDDAVVADINRLMGQRVSLTYEQKIGLPTSCFGDSEYFVTAVHPVAEPGAGGPPGNPTGSPPSANPPSPPPAAQ